MRLICPNCDAQYEVPDGVIPPEGRDVQCSNCSHTWYFTPVGTAPTDDAEDPVSDSAPVDAEDAADEDIAPPVTDTAVEDPPSVPNEPAPKPQPRELDDTLKSILQEEARREAEARSREAEPLESQPDLGLNDLPLRDPAPQENRAPAEPDTDREPEAPRRDLLPDIEEINSTLRSTSERSEDGDPVAHAVEAQETRQGFGRGFSYTILLAVILVAVYVFAPEISETFPGMNAALSGYVAQVDNVRVWLDQQIVQILQMLDAAAGEGVAIDPE